MNMPADYYDRDDQSADHDIDLEASDGDVQTLGDERSHEQMHQEIERRGQELSGDAINDD